MKIFLIIAAILLFISVVPFRFHIYISDEAARIYLSYLGIRFYDSGKKKKTDKEKISEKDDDPEAESDSASAEAEQKSEEVFPGDQKKKNTDIKNEQTGEMRSVQSANKKNTSDNNKDSKDKEKNIFSHFLEIRKDNPELFSYYISKALKAISKILKSVSIKKLCIIIRVGGEDAYATAMNYSHYNQIIWPAVGTFTSLIQVKIKRISITPDFTREETSGRISLTANIRLCDIIAAAVVLLVQFILAGFLVKDRYKVPDNK